MNERHLPSEGAYLVAVVMSQLQTNKSQIDKLEHYLAALSMQTMARLFVGIILASGVVLFVTLFVKSDVYHLGEIRGLLPAASLILGFGVYRAFSAYLQLGSTRQELHHLLKRQYRAIEAGEWALRRFEEEAE